jgi:hypothetical protein
MSYQPSFLKRAARLLPAVVFAATLGAAHAEDSLIRIVNDPTLEWGPCPAFLGTGCELAVVHGDPSKPNTDVFFKVPGDYDIVNHWHTSAERMVLLTGKMSVTYDGEKSGLLLPGRYAYGPAKKHHKAYCHAGESCILFIAFEEPVDAFAVH